MPRRRQQSPPRNPKTRPRQRPPRCLRPSRHRPPPRRPSAGLKPSPTHLRQPPERRRTRAPRCASSRASWASTLLVSRARARKDAAPVAEKAGLKLTMLAFLVKASVNALKEFPEFNASLDKSGENLIVKKYYHIGVAVDTPDGLLVPVIRDADRKGVFDLAKELAEISRAAREKKLKPDSMLGGSFSISSLGGIGGTAFTPIINAPEVAILGVARSQMRPVYKDGAFAP